MMNKIVKSSLFKNTGIYTLTSILNSAIPFLLLPVLTRYMSPEDYGMVSMYLLLVSLATPFVGLNVNSAITRKYYDKDEVNIWEYVFNCFLILLVSTAVVAIVFWVFAKPISSVSQFPAELLWLTVVFSFGRFISSIVLALWQVQKKAFLFGLFNNLQTLTNVTLSIVFVVSMGLSWRGRIYGQLIAIVLFSFIAIFILFKNKWIKFSYNKAYIANALMFGVPLIPHALSGAIISMTDRFFITNMIGLGATGIYTVGYQIGSIINLLAMSFNNAFVPWLFERLKQNKFIVKVKIVKFTYLYFIVILMLAIGLGVLAPPLLNVFLGKTFNESSIYVVWVALGYAFNGMYLMVVNYIFYSQRTKSLAAVTFMTAILNVILNYFFIKNFGAIGAAQATTIVFAVKFIVVFILSAKVHEMPWNLLKVKKQINN